MSTLTQETDSVPLTVRGAIPAWLSGSLIRTGPARFEVGRSAYNHWFDGLAMLHKFSIDDGAVTYSNRYLGSQAYRSAMSAGKITYSEFATDPCRTLFQRFLTVFLPKPTDNGNVNVNKVPGGLAAFTETPLPIRFRPDTLEALGVYEYDRRLKGQLSTAHPHYDTARSLQYTYTIRLGRKSAYHVIAIASDGAQRLVGSIPTDQPAYMHSFGMTENYLVIAEFPLVVNPLELALAGKPFIRNYRWRPERGVRVHVVHKDEGTVRRVADVPPLFCFITSTRLRMRPGSWSIW